MLCTLRSLTPVRNALPPSKINFPVNYLVRGAPEPLTDARSTDRIHPTRRAWKVPRYTRLRMSYSDRQASIWRRRAICSGPWGDVTSANITQDSSGINYYTETGFITVLRTGYVGARKLKSIMPFGELQKLVR